ncbi:MAG: UDP-glucuronosyltransferase [Cytophagaceae bacterium]|nr:UDP-glucuronosyltransferase [Cytophagaceae bacterium]
MKILYGVPGEGMGHATRSRVVLEHLLQEGHEVKIVSSGRAYSFLQKHFGERVVEIQGFHLAYKNSSVSKLKTLGATLQHAPKNLWKNFQKYESIKEHFIPDLIISDFESFTFFFAKKHKIPFISIDNMQVIDRCKMEIPVLPSEKSNYAIAKAIIQAKVPGAQRYFVTTFFYPPVTKANTLLVPPIIRPEIIQARTSEKNHVVVYQTSTSQKNLVSILQQIPQENFWVYGFNKEEDHGNVRLKSFSEKGFIDDLASCKAVIANGGFSFISEAVYLHKPICSVPIAQQFEQYVNAQWVAKEGYGRYFPEFTADAIKAFLYEVPRFRETLSAYRQHGNEALFEHLDAYLQNMKRT